MKTKGYKRQALSLHVCYRLWVDFNIRPTSTKIREITQIGSMTNLSQDIKLFWREIQSRLKEQRPSFVNENEIKENKTLFHKKENDIYEKYINSITQLNYMNNEMRLKSEEYAKNLFELTQNIEKRFKPMLVELDRLRLKTQEVEKEKEKEHQLLKMLYQEKCLVESLQAEIKRLQKK